MNIEHFRKLENLYHKAPTNEYFQPKLTISEGAAELILNIRQDFFHAANAVHGAYYFKALDDSAFFAANSLVDDVFVLTANFNLHLLRPVSSGQIIARATVVSRTKNTLLADAICFDSQENQIARGTGSFVKSNILLTKDIGYIM